MLMMVLTLSDGEFVLDKHQTGMYILNEYPGAYKAKSPVCTGREVV